jgi:hypothetical protein
MAMARGEQQLEERFGRTSVFCCGLSTTVAEDGEPAKPLYNDQYLQRTRPASAMTGLREVLYLRSWSLILHQAVRP